jgi:hypothetical protein
MAKRRNLKKEKALRNLEYARKFRKRGGTGRMGGRRRFPGAGGQQGDDNNQEDMSGNTEGAAD